MSIGSFRPCPHCNAPLAFLEGANGSSLAPKCPRCHEAVAVTRATFLMADNSRPSTPAKQVLPGKPS